MSHKFHTLDGLRGVAAISVMAYHRRNWFGGDEFLGHAFLAVDFFFLLSGFVLAHAYGNRLRKHKAIGPFIRERIIRLHPMLLAGAGLAMLVAFLEAWKLGVATNNLGIYALAHAVPFPVMWGTATAAFPWNIAIWSLFWELIANVIFAILIPYLNTRNLSFIIIINVMMMIIISTSMNGFQVGFARDISQFVWGFPRVCASFFLGVFIYDKRQIISVKVPFASLVCTLLLVLTFCAVPSRSKISIIYDPLIAYGVYPILLLIAARAEPMVPRMAIWLGSISYPLYVIHEPMLKIVSGMLKFLRMSDDHQNQIDSIIRLGIVVIIAFLILKVYDEPVRARLRYRFKR